MRHLASVIALLSIVFLQTSCVPDSCKDTLCENDAVCLNGDCICVYGYEGAFCENAWHSKFTGNWKVTEDSIPPAGANEYLIKIDNKRTVDTLFMLGIAEMFDTVLATRESYLSFTMKERKLNDDTVLLSGIGTIDEQTGIVTGKYSLKLVDKTVNVNFSWIKE